LPPEKGMSASLFTLHSAFSLSKSRKRLFPHHIKDLLKKMHAQFTTHSKDADIVHNLVA